MEINQAGIDLLKSFEECRLAAFKPLPTDPWTIGWGHTGDDVTEGLCWTQARADEVLTQDLQRFCTAVDNAVFVKLSDNQFAALVDFVYNVGVEAFEKSTLLRLLNEGNYSDAAKQFQYWDHSAGRVIEGLSRRRAAETALFNS